MRNAEARGATIVPAEPTNPGFESLDEGLSSEPSRNAEGWYDVGDATQDGAAAELDGLSQEQAEELVPQTSNSVLNRLLSQIPILAALVALMAMLAAMLAWVYMKRRREEEGTNTAPATVLTAGVRASMKEETGAPITTVDDPVPDAEPAIQKAEPKPAYIREAEPEVARASVSPGAQEPLSLDVSLDIIGATRSLMRLSVEFTLEVCNRSTHPVKNVNIAGELACAKEGATGPAPIDKTQGLTVIERIAPQQSRRVTGTLQLPIGEISAIKQNGRPVVIPLMHFRIGTANQHAIKRTFVVGTPSSSSATRVHPLVFDGPPGGLPPLRAQLIKQP